MAPPRYEAPADNYEGGRVMATKDENEVSAFENFFENMTGNPPFPWQRALFEQLVAGEFPAACNLPTGLGKTAIIPIWLLALAESPGVVPRRLVYVVNRRTVVDQATR